MIYECWLKSHMLKVQRRDVLIADMTMKFRCPDWTMFWSLCNHHEIKTISVPLLRPLKKWMEEAFHFGFEGIRKQQRVRFRFPPIASNS
jgi:hypothetical protein